MPTSSLLDRALSVFKGDGPATLQKTVLLESGKNTVKVAGRDVLYIEAAANYSVIITRTQRIRVRGSLKALQANFRDAGHTLIRIHRSHLVAPGAVLNASDTRAGDVRLLMSDGTILLASRRYRENFETIFKTT